MVMEFGSRRWLIEQPHPLPRRDRQLQDQSSGAILAMTVYYLDWTYHCILHFTSFGNIQTGLSGIIPRRLVLMLTARWRCTEEIFSIQNANATRGFRPSSHYIPLGRFVTTLGCIRQSRLVAIKSCQNTKFRQLNYTQHKANVRTVQ